jgi:hypothetical protein
MLSWKLFLGILVCTSWAQASDEYERMRQLGHNAKFGPNLLTRSKFNRQAEDTATRVVLHKFWPFITHQLITDWLQRAESGKALEDYLLPDDVQPLSYAVHLVTYLQNAPAPTPDFSFTGLVQIKIRAERPVAQIRMHARDLLIRDINVTQVTEITMHNQVIIITSHAS